MEAEAAAGKSDWTLAGTKVSGASFRAERASANPRQFLQEDYVTELYYDYFLGRPVRVTEKSAAEYEAIRARLKTVKSIDEARAIIIEANRLFTRIA